MKSDVRHTSIYKFVLGLNETGGTLFLPHMSKYVWTITTYYLALGVQPNQDISNHPNNVKISGLRLTSSSSNQLFRKGINPAFPNNSHI